MTIATADRPKLTTQMGRKEAEKITNDIRANFDSLGKMLIEMRDRKGFSALGYQSLESYCLTEFGKGKARVYQLIEEAKIEEGITAELAASDSPIKSLKMPGTYLRELKVLETPRQQIEAIAYANKLANNEGKTKATITHLQAAINKLNSKKIEQTKQIFKAIGFDKGAEVEVLEGRAKGERGVIRKIDKKGVHVELYSGNSTPITWDVSELRVVPAEERPKQPTMMDTINIGDKVRIFSSNNNQGKTGELVARINDKQALVVVEGRKSEIPYAELERIEIVNETQAQTTDLIWAGSWNPLASWYYNAKANEIHSFPCPDLTLHPPVKCPSPSDWLEKWRQKNVAAIADALFTEDDLAALVVATTSKMSPEEKEAFWGKVNVRNSHSEAVELRIENAELQAQLEEAKTVIQSIVNVATITTLEVIPEPAEAEVYFLPGGMPEPTPGEAASASDFLLENASEISSPKIIPADWHSILAANNFTPNYQYTDDCTEEYRGWTIYLDPNGGYNYIDLNHPEKGGFCCDTNFLSIEFKDEEEIIKWAKEVINQVEDFCPGQLSLKLEAVTTDSSATGNHLELTPEIADRILNLRDKFRTLIEEYEDSKLATSKIKELKHINKNIEVLQENLKNLERFEQFKIGQTVYHKRNPLILGQITKLDLPPKSEMPLLWIKYLKEGEWEESATAEVAKLVFPVTGEEAKS